MAVAPVADGKEEGEGKGRESATTEGNDQGTKGKQSTEVEQEVVDEVEAQAQREAMPPPLSPPPWQQGTIEEDEGKPDKEVPQSRREEKTGQGEPAPPCSQPKEVIEVREDTHMNQAMGHQLELGSYRRKKKQLASRPSSTADNGTEEGLSGGTFRRDVPRERERSPPPNRPPLMVRSSRRCFVSPERREMDRLSRRTGLGDPCPYDLSLGPGDSSRPDDGGDGGANVIPEMEKEDVDMGYFAQDSEEEEDSPLMVADRGPPFMTAVHSSLQAVMAAGECYVFMIGVMINGDGWGHSYSIVRGEILGFMDDELLRKHLPRTFSLIKNESWGIEDDQIPS
ncbi:hypothetical protein CBR_g56704 [Chara braunii]|uniref:Uncharacterized protein n=1 Tax=Chara braunii TaxID=69332 RepID=A0A388MDN3_CHABU|nr:hypothetical protein CBR_g56704 [Chara braunii]|eukprot:GBG92674.1 hypothetical protein CBR_g56704 [Chara braunii]